MGFGPAVVRNEKGDVTLHHISSSQVGTYESCPHRWYEEKVQGAPSFSDWSWAEAGVAAHELLEEQVGALIDKEFNEKKRRVLDPDIQDEAEKLVSYFKWEEYFEEHQIIDVEMDMTLSLSELDYEMQMEELGEEKAVKKDYPLFVGSMDVVSINKEGVVVVTDWKTGYGAHKGVDIQAQAYALGIMQNMGYEEAIFRRIYPRLVGETKGTKRVEEMYFNKKDAMRYARKIIFLAGKMKETAESTTITPKVTASDSCVHCPVAYRCPIASSAAFTPKELTEKLKVLKAATNQVNNALKNTVDEGGDFYVGDEHWGYSMSEFYRGPRGGLKAEEVFNLILEKKPEMLKGKCKITIDDTVKDFLEEHGHTGYKYQNRKTLKLLNEKELKEAAKNQKDSQTTLGEIEKEKEKAA